MKIKTSLVGSFPPIFDPYQSYDHEIVESQNNLIRESIIRAVNDQVNLGIDILVDGQIRGDIVSIFCNHLPGFTGNRLPFQVIGKIKPYHEPITVNDFLIAKNLIDKTNQLQENQIELKAHLTGPMTLARDAIVDPSSSYIGKTDPNLVLDIANALGNEAKFLIQAGAQTIQIDEPILRGGVDLELAFQAMKIIIEAAEIPNSGLHICGNTSNILENVLQKSPVNFISLESMWLNQDKLLHINKNYLSKSNKKLGLGVIKVADYSIEKRRSVQMLIEHLVLRFGEENIWAVTPNCGLRLMPYDIALEKLTILTQAVKTLNF